MKSTGKLNLYMAAAVAAPLIWGFFSIPLRQLHHYPAQQILYYRVFTSLLIIWIINLTFRRKAVVADIRAIKSVTGAERKKLWWLVLATGVFITANWFSYIYVVNNVSLQVAAFAYLICPLLTACGGFLILKEPLSKFKLAAVFIAVFSIIILSTGSLVQAMWSLWVASMYAVYLVIQRTINHLDKLTLLGIQLVIATAILLPFFIYNYQPVPKEAGFWLNIVLISAIFTILPLTLSLFALTGLPSSTLGITLYINPIIAFSIAFMYFNEAFDYSQLAGYALLLVSVICFNAELLPLSAFKKRVLKTAI